MIDYLGNTLSIGDECVLIEPNYRNYIKARIIKFTPENVRLQFEPKHRGADTILQHPSQLVKIIKEN